MDLYYQVPIKQEYPEDLDTLGFKDVIVGEVREGFKNPGYGKCPPITESGRPKS